MGSAASPPPAASQEGEEVEVEEGEEQPPAAVGTVGGGSGRGRVVVDGSTEVIRSGSGRGTGVVRGVVVVDNPDQRVAADADAFTTKLAMVLGQVLAVPALIVYCTCGLGGWVGMVDVGEGREGRGEAGLVAGLGVVCVP
jgi:hypothetical protein